jgi:hypothetical protein
MPQTLANKVLVLIVAGVVLFLSCTCIAYLSPENIYMAENCGYKVLKIDTLLTIDTRDTGVPADTVYKVYFRAPPPCVTH